MSEKFSVIAASFPEPFHLLQRESVASTNDDLRSLAQAGAATGLVLLAHEQTAGRGRRGNVWFSPTHESLAFSILLRPQQPKALWPRLALAAGLAVAEALESFNVTTGIKWPNDVWVRGRKIAGILVEAGSDFAIVGIGLNVRTREFPSAVSEIATSLLIETNLLIPRDDVLGTIIQRFARRQHQIGSDFDELLDDVRQRCVLSGRSVSLTTSNGLLRGVVEGIAPGGELLLRTPTDLLTLIQADEIRILD